MATITQTESPTTANQSVGQHDNKEQKMMATYSKKLTVEVGKTLRGELAKAKIFYDAKIDFATLGTKGSHERWLDSARVNESTASMYRLIHASELIHSDKYTDQLPADYTKLYQLARVEKAFKDAPAKAEKMFLDALDFINVPTKVSFVSRSEHDQDERFGDRFTTAASLQSHVNGLMGKPKPESANKGQYKGTGPQTARTLVKVGTSPTTGIDLAAAGIAPPVKDDVAEEVETEEPSLEAIQEELEREFQADDNDVLFGKFVLQENEVFNQAYRQLQIKKRLYHFMRTEGMKHMKVTLQEMAATA